MKWMGKSVKIEMKNPTQLPNVVVLKTVHCISNADSHVLFKGNT